MYYRSLNAYLRETFGCKVYKLALSAGCTCPNRDGTIGTRGCIFCSGSGEFAASASLSIPEQLAQAKRLVAAKAGPDARYIAYFQDFTNTYAPAEVLRPLFAAAIRQPEVCALSIATRPDCLRRRSYRCWLSSGRKSPSGSSSGCKPSMHRRPPISAAAIPFPSMTRRCGRCTRAASASSRTRSWACPARRRR